MSDAEPWREAWRKWDFNIPPPLEPLTVNENAFRAGYLAATAHLSAEREDHHRFGSPPRPVSNPSQAWCDAYAAWYHQEPEQ